MTPCDCRGLYILFCAHPRTCARCGALTTGTRPADMDACGGCSQKAVRRAYGDGPQLARDLRSETLDRAMEEMLAVVEGVLR